MSGREISFPWPCEVTGRAETVGAVACLCRGCRGAALAAENAELRAEIDGVDLAFEGLEETERGRRIGQWIGVAADATTRAGELEAENARLLGMIDSMSTAANQLVSAARPHCPTDRNLAQAWKRMRGAIPIRLVGSVARPAAPVEEVGGGDVG